MIYVNYGDDFVEPTLEEEWADRMDAADRATRAEDQNQCLECNGQGTFSFKKHYLYVARKSL